MKQMDGWMHRWMLGQMVDGWDRIWMDGWIGQKQLNR